MASPFYLSRRTTSGIPERQSAGSADPGGASLSHVGRRWRRGALARVRAFSAAGAREIAPMVEKGDEPGDDRRPVVPAGTRRVHVGRRMLRDVTGAGQCVGGGP